MENISFITGGAGFIGSNFILRWLKNETGKIVNIDKMTYAGNPYFLTEMKKESRHIHEKVDIADRDRLLPLFRDYRPKTVIHFAGESHVDRSITDPSPFLHTNIIGTFTLLEAVRHYFFQLLSHEDQQDFRFLHISTDEVFGSLNLQHNEKFTETSCYEPSTPYAASKASGDHLVRSWQKTYRIPTISVHCSNNYGQRQSPEKLIPKTIINILNGNPMTVYGDGLHQRNWLYVDDCCDAIYRVWKQGRIGERYNIGGFTEKNVLNVIETIYNFMKETGTKIVLPIRNFIRLTSDRPGNDRCYALNSEKIKTELGWEPVTDFDTGIKRTIDWYQEHRDWLNEAADRNQNVF
jgi:dTDP-glucose 4,6-dehydratase